MESLWSMSTTVREADRVLGFLNTANELDGQIWNKDNQIKFQILLIKNRQYLNDETNTQTFNKLSPEQIDLLKNKAIDLTYEQAESIFNSKNYKDPDMRGRNSMSPLKKLGLVFIVNDYIKVTNVGKKLINGDILFGDFILDSMLKYQLPNPSESWSTKWNTKPFITTLRLIEKVNQLCKDKNMKEKGISSDEFGIFALSLKKYTDVEIVADLIINFRVSCENLKDKKQKKQYRESYINSYLSEFKNPIKNVREYTDNMIRYLRQTKYIFIRGKYNNTYIDLEPRRMLEIKSILESDNGSCGKYTQEDWMNYMGTYGSYKLPFEKIETLTKILEETYLEINKLENKLGLENTEFKILNDKDYLKQEISKAREYRIILRNKEIKFDYAMDISKIDTAIQMLQDIQDYKVENFLNKPSVELEKWTNIALNIINDAESIKPNTPVGDDNEPTYTAPANVPDIECYYGAFGMICEVTMLKGRDQWFNEGQPVMRHLRDFEDKNSIIPNYCLFIAPKLHQDTLETYWNSVKYNYRGSKQKIIPITIKQFIDLLKSVKQLKESGKTIKRENLKMFYDLCTDISSFDDSSLWSQFINDQFCKWHSSLFSEKQ